MSMIRDSSFELLRIFAMICVISHHIILHTFENFGLIQNILNSLFIIGVNLFILISGYFQIKFSISKLMKLYVIGVFCTLIMKYVFLWEAYSNLTIKDYILYFTSTDIWYIPNYIALFFISPLLNTAINNTKKNQILLIVFCLVFMNIYMGYMRALNFNTNGYSLVNFIFIYTIGAYMRKFPIILPTRILFILLSISIFFTTIWAEYFQPCAFFYNNPFVVLTSLIVFQIFSKIKMKSNIINTIGNSVFIVFLIHDPFVNYIVENYDTNSVFIWMIQIILMIILVYIIAIIISFITNLIFKIVKHTFFLQKIDNIIYSYIK